MKHLYRNLICITLIVVALAGITLMCLNLTGIFTDNLMDMALSYYDGGAFDDLIPKDFQDKVILTYETDYSGLVYFRTESRGNYNNLTKSFGNPNVYRGTENLNPRFYYAEKIQESQNTGFDISVNLQTSLNDRKICPDYSFYGIETDTKTNDCYSLAPKEETYTYETTMYPDPDESTFEPSFADPYVATEELKYRQFVEKTYLDIRDDKKEALLSFMDAHGIDKNSTTLPEDIREFFNDPINGYKTDVTEERTPSGQDALMYFLNEKKVGLFTNYTTASVLMLRAAGWPSRFVSGFWSISYPGIEKVVKGMNLYTWVEYYVPGTGWKRVDTTSMNFGENCPISGLNGTENNGNGGLSSGIYQGGEDNRTNDPVFRYHTDTYKGTLYFRNRSVGDYQYGQGSFADVTDPYVAKTLNPLYFYTYHLGDVSESYGISFTGISSDPAIVPDYSFPLYDETAGNDSCVPYPNHTDLMFETSFYPNDPQEVPMLSEWNGKEEEERYQEYVYSHYLNVPEKMKIRLDDYISENNIFYSGNDAEDVMDFFSTHYSYGYSDTVYPEDEDPVLYFLENCNLGICSNFASSTVLLLREKGIPARMVLGYLCDADPSQSVQTATTKGAHAWTEYYVPGIGWRRLDTTPGGSGGNIPSPDEEGDKDSSSSSSLPSEESSSGSSSVPTKVEYNLFLTRSNASIGGLENINSASSDYAYKVYDGKPLTDFDPKAYLDSRYFYNTSTMVSQTFSSYIEELGYTYDVKTTFPPVDGGIVDAGNYPIRVDVTIYDENKKDITSDFDTTIYVFGLDIHQNPSENEASLSWLKQPGSGVYGTYTIGKRNLILSSNSLEKTEDGNPFDPLDFTYSFEDDTSLAEDDEMEVRFEHQDDMDVTWGSNTFTVIITHNGRDVSEVNYDIEYRFGSFNIYEGLDTAS